MHWLEFTPDLPCLSSLFFSDGCFLLFHSLRLLYLPQLYAFVTADCCFATVTSLDLDYSHIRYLSLGNGSCRFASDVRIRTLSREN